MQALQQPVLLNEIRAEVDLVRETDPGFDRHPLLKSAIIRRLEQTSIS